MTSLLPCPSLKMDNRWLDVIEVEDYSRWSCVYQHEAGEAALLGFKLVGMGLEDKALLFGVNHSLPYVKVSFPHQQCCGIDVFVWVSVAQPRRNTEVFTKPRKTHDQQQPMMLCYTGWCPLPWLCARFCVCTSCKLVPERYGLLLIEVKISKPFHLSACLDKLIYHFSSKHGHWEELPKPKLARGLG